jgi:uncharacterized membrane protein
MWLNRIPEDKYRKFQHDVHTTFNSIGYFIIYIAETTIIEIAVIPLNVISLVDEQEQMFYYVPILPTSLDVFR